MDAHAPTSTSAPVTACDGVLFKYLLVGALAWFEQHYKYVDQLNVFPVPDGDTGTNMLLTVRNAYKEILGYESSEIGVIAVRFAHGALRGSRGNSGTILSELFRGFAHELSGRATADGALFARAFREAVKFAYGVVQQPIEGTILTVARETANEIDLAVGETDDLREVLRRAATQSQNTVMRTPDMLPILRKAGVVDSGGQGLAYLIEGMWRQARGERLLIANVQHTNGVPSDHVPPSETRSVRSALSSADPLGYGYDVQYVVRGQHMDIGVVRTAIGQMGVSMVVVGDENLIKVHIHVHDPGIPLSYGVKLGVLEDIVVENMQAQSEAYIAARDSGAIEPMAGSNTDFVPANEPDEPPEVPVNLGEIAVVAVVPGKGLRRVFRGLGVAAVIDGGQSMNPSSGELVDAIAALDTDRIILLPNNKNIQLTAEQAVKLIADSGLDKQVRVVPTRTIPQGIAALLSFNAEGNLDAVTQTMSAARTGVVTGEVTTATRSIELDGVTVQAGELIGLIDGTLSVSGADFHGVIKDLLERMDVTERELVTLYYGADVNTAEAEALTEALRAAYPGQEFEVFEGGQAYYFYILSVE
ncbi:MAG: DAK2 domain-containing protein [Aggregatilineales bacterium]